MHIEKSRTATTGDQDIATAPGDLPMPEVQARFASLRRQFRHDNTISPLAPRPHDSVEIEASAGIDVPVRRAAVFYTTDGSEPTELSNSAPMQLASVEWSPGAGYVRRFRGVLPGQPTGSTVRYRIAGWRQEPSTGAPDAWAQDGQGFWFKYSAAEGVTTFAFPVKSPQPPMPAWMNSAVIYHIFVDRFHPGNEDGTFPAVSGARVRHGGTLKGIRAAIPYLYDLGVTCVWLSPIHPSKTYHRYDGEDYFAVATLRGMDSWRSSTPSGDGSTLCAARCAHSIRSN